MCREKTWDTAVEVSLIGRKQVEGKNTFRIEKFGNPPGRSDESKVVGTGRYHMCGIWNWTLKWVSICY